MRRVLIESPYAGDVDKNLRYLRACMADALRRDEAPFASHALYTQPGVLDDKDPAERKLGISAGFVWGQCAELIAFYIDLGWSPGMLAAEKFWANKSAEATARGLPQVEIEMRRIGSVWTL